MGQVRHKATAKTCPKTAEEEKYLQEQLNTGVVVPSSSAWASPVVLVRKKSDNTVRWCIDYRRLNEVTVKDAYPLPRIDMSIDCLGAAQYFTTLDLQAGYWQLELEESSRAKTRGVFEESSRAKTAFIWPV